MVTIEKENYKGNELDRLITTLEGKQRRQTVHK